MAPKFRFLSLFVKLNNYCKLHVQACFISFEAQPVVFGVIYWSTVVLFLFVSQREIPAASDTVHVSIL